MAGRTPHRPPERDDDLVVFGEKPEPTPAPSEPRGLASHRKPRSYAPDNTPATWWHWFLAQFGLPMLIGTHRTGWPVATWLIAVALVVIQLVATRYQAGDAMMYRFDDPPWVAVTAFLLHSGLWHLFGNLWGLLVFGGAVEQAVPRLAYVTAFFLLGPITILAEGAVHPDVYVVGASGAILGTLGACLFLQPQATVTFGFFPFVFRVPMFMYMAVYASLQIVGLLGGQGRVAFVGHLVGLFAGLVLGRVANSVWPDEPDEP